MTPPNSSFPMCPSTSSCSLAPNPTIIPFRNASPTFHTAVRLDACPPASFPASTKATANQHRGAHNQYREAPSGNRLAHRRSPARVSPACRPKAGTLGVSCALRPSPCSGNRSSRPRRVSGLDQAAGAVKVKKSHTTSRRLKKKNRLVNY